MSLITPHTHVHNLQLKLAPGKPALAGLTSHSIKNRSTAMSLPDFVAGFGFVGSVGNPLTSPSSSSS